MTIEHTPDSNLDWLAFQYAAGELQGAELQEFEKLLATDERACTALSRAVMLGQAVVQCEHSSSAVARPISPADSRSVARRRFLQQQIVAIAAVACSLLCVAWWSLNTASPRTSNEAVTVASLWINGADDEAIPESAVADHEVSEFDDEPVPGWLLAAVSEEQAGEDGEVMND